MSSPDPRVSTCRRCKHYVLQGRRGGHCDKLNVSVQGSWQPCPLAIPVFASTLELVKLVEIDEFHPIREFEPVPNRG